MCGYGTGGGDVGVREGGNLRPKTLICGGGDRYGGRYIKRRERREERRGRREEDGGEKDRKAVRKEGEGREGREEGGRRERREARCRERRRGTEKESPQEKQKDGGEGGVVRCKVGR